MFELFSNHAKLLSMDPANTTNSLKIVLQSFLHNCVIRNMQAVKLRRDRSCVNERANNCRGVRNKVFRPIQRSFVYFCSILKRRMLTFVTTRMRTPFQWNSVKLICQIFAVQQASYVTAFIYFSQKHKFLWFILADVSAEGTILRWT